MHEHLERDHLTVPWQSVEYQAASPLHAEFGVLGIGVEKAEHGTSQRLLHIVVEDDVVSVCLLHFLVEIAAAGPVPVVIDEDCMLDGGLLRGGNHAQKRICGFGVGEDGFVVLF
jgi:hypothetical protein